jgi:hypothetical protein
MSGFLLVLGTLVMSCRLRPPSTAAPENLKFRSYRLEGARPTAFGYSVISDRHTWERFVRSRTTPSNSSLETPPIDFKAHTLVILQATSGTQCFDEPVVRRVTRQADTVRVLLGTLMGPCQAADYWTQVIELPRFRGPVRVDYPLDQFRPGWNEHEIQLRAEVNNKPGAHVVPAEPPDSVPAWFHDDSSFVSVTERGRFLRGVIIVFFIEGASQAMRQEAIDRIGGQVIGGTPLSDGDGFYYVRVQDDGTGAQLEEAVATLSHLPQVEMASLIPPGGTPGGTQ